MNVDILVPTFPPAHWNFAFAMELLHDRMKLRSIFFIDDHFLGNRRFAKNILEELRRFVERARHKPIFS